MSSTSDRSASSTSSPTRDDAVNALRASPHRANGRPYSRYSDGRKLTSPEEGDSDSTFVPMDIHTAAALGFIERLKELLASGIDCDVCNVGGWTPLMYAAYVGSNDATYFLLNEGKANVDVCAPNGCTALMFAASCGNEAIASILLQHGANINARDMMGRTALYYTACQGHHDVSKLLVDNKADIEVRETEYGFTSLMVAAQEGHETVVNILLAYHADVKAVSSFGHSARTLADRYGNVMIVSLIDNALHSSPAESLRRPPGLLDDPYSSSPHFDHCIPSPPSSSGIDIRDGPTALARLVNKGATPDDHTAGDVASAALRRGLLTQNGVSNGRLHPDNHTVFNDNGSPGVEHPYLALIDNDVTSETGGNYFALNAAETMRPASGDSNDSSSGSADITQQLAELHLPVGKRRVIASERLPNRDNNSDERPQLEGHGGQNQQSSGQKTRSGLARQRDHSGRHSVESDSPSSSQELTHPRAKAKAKQSWPTSLAELLEELKLTKYLPIFEREEITLNVFFTLTDDDLKKIGLNLFGPRRKITSAISRWHGQAWTGCSTLEQAYGDRLDTELQEVAAKYRQALSQLEAYSARLQQEQELRTITETCLLDLQRHLRQCHSAAHQACQAAGQQLQLCCTAHGQLASALSGTAAPDHCAALQQLSEQLHVACQLMSNVDAKIKQINP